MCCIVETEGGLFPLCCYSCGQAESESSPHINILLHRASIYARGSDEHDSS